MPSDHTRDPKPSMPKHAVRPIGENPGVGRLTRNTLTPFART
jgi:hypothetical protein